MSFLGMGTLEILTILLVGFILLGPDKLASVARSLGKLVKEARNFSEGISDLGLNIENPDITESTSGETNRNVKASLSDKSTNIKKRTESSVDNNPVNFQSHQISANQSEETEEKKDS